MLRVYADTYVALGQDFQQMEMLAEGFSKSSVQGFPSERILNREALENVVGLFIAVRDHCKDLGLKVCATIAEGMTKDFSTLDAYSWDIVGPRIAELRRCFVAEMESRLCYMILPGRESYYAEDPSAFVSKETLKKFPSIKFDLTEAGKCFATERFTACVNHLVKVAEYAYLSFIRYAGLSPEMEKNWNRGLNALHESIRNKDIPFNKLSDDAERYFVELEGYLRTFKTAWRNPASHVPIIFIEGQARSIFEVVRTLMNFAAERLGETMTKSSHEANAKGIAAQ